MAKTMLNDEQKKTIGEMNEALGGLTMEDLQVLCGCHFHFPVYPEDPVMEQDVTCMDLNPRAINALKRMGIFSIRTLIESIESESDLLRFRNLGKLTAREIMFDLFLFQFRQLSKDGRKHYMKRVLEMNGIRKNTSQQTLPQAV